MDKKGRIVMSDALNCSEIQSVCYDMLRFFSEYAKKNKLRFYMAGGTLLGAVRHKGFIPWDDDVDLMMPRRDYNRLIKIFHDDRYQLSCCERDKKYKTPFLRIWDNHTVLKWDYSNEKEIGAFIDIFPIDGFPVSEFKTKIHLYHIKMYRSMLNLANRTGYYKNEKNVTIKKICKFFLRKDGNAYARALNRVAVKYKYDKCDYVGVKTTSPHLFKEKNSKSIFRETVFLPFHDLKLPAPGGYDIYLKHLYGDYKQLPPEDKRITEHMFKIYKITKNNKEEE